MKIKLNFIKLAISFILIFVSCFGAWQGPLSLSGPPHGTFIPNLYFSGLHRVLAFGRGRLSSPTRPSAAPHWQLVVFARNIYPNFC